MRLLYPGRSTGAGGQCAPPAQCIQFEPPSSTSAQSQRRLQTLVYPNNQCESSFEAQQDASLHEVVASAVPDSKGLLPGVHQTTAEEFTQ